MESSRGVAEAEEGGGEGSPPSMLVLVLSLSCSGCVCGCRWIGGVDKWVWWLVVVVCTSRDGGRKSAAWWGRSSGSPNPKTNAARGARSVDFILHARCVWGGGGGGGQNIAPLLALWLAGLVLVPACPGFALVCACVAAARHEWNNSARGGGPYPYSYPHTHPATQGSSASNASSSISFLSLPLRHGHPPLRSRALQASPSFPPTASCSWWNSWTTPRCTALLLQELSLANNGTDACTCM